MAPPLHEGQRGYFAYTATVAPTVIPKRDTMTEAKDFIRAEALRHRNNLHIDPAWSEQAARLFVEQILPIVAEKPRPVVALYFPRDREMDTLTLAETLWNKDFPCALPVITGGVREMLFARWNKDTELKAGAFDIPEPAIREEVEPDIVVVPLLAFDQQGHRLGYGKGFYDVALKKLRMRKPDVLLVGLAYAEQACLFALPVEDHDEKLDFVLTPQRIFDFRR